MVDGRVSRTADVQEVRARLLACGLCRSQNICDCVGDLA